MNLCECADGGEYGHFSRCSRCQGEIRDDCALCSGLFRLDDMFDAEDWDQPSGRYCYSCAFLLEKEAV